MMLPKPKYSSWRSLDASTFDLPIYNPNSAIGKRGHSRCTRSIEKFVHLIPLVIILCIFVLWCLSSPVNMEIRDGRFTAAVHHQEISRSRAHTERLIDHTILATSTTNASFPLMILVPPNINTTEAAPQPASESGTLVPSVLHVP